MAPRPGPVAATLVLVASALGETAREWCPSSAAAPHDLALLQRATRVQFSGPALEDLLNAQANDDLAQPPPLQLGYAETQQANDGLAQPARLQQGYPETQDANGRAAYGFPEAPLQQYPVGLQGSYGSSQLQRSTGAVQRYGTSQLQESAGLQEGRLSSAASMLRTASSQLSQLQLHLQQQQQATASAQARAVHDEQQLAASERSLQQSRATVAALERQLQEQKGKEAELEHELRDESRQLAASEAKVRSSEGRVEDMEARLQNAMDGQEALRSESSRAEQARNRSNFELREQHDQALRALQMRSEQLSSSQELLRKGEAELAQAAQSLQASTAREASLESLLASQREVLNFVENKAAQDALRLNATEALRQKAERRLMAVRLEDGERMNASEARAHELERLLHASDSSRWSLEDRLNASLTANRNLQTQLAQEQELLRSREQQLLQRRVELLPWAELLNRCGDLCFTLAHAEACCGGATYPISQRPRGCALARQVMSGEALAPSLCSEALSAAGGVMKASAAPVQALGGGM